MGAVFFGTERLLSGHPLSAGIAIESALLPRQFMQFAMSKPGARLLAEGSHIAPRGLQYSKWLIRFMDALDEAGQPDKPRPKPVEAPSSFGVGP